MWNFIPDPIRRFARHAWGCFVMAKEGQSNIGEWIALLVGLTALISPPFLHWYLHLEARDAWHIAIGGVVFLLLRGFWHSFSQYDELSERQKPKLDIRCSPGLPGCIPKNLGVNFVNKFFRVEIESVCDTDVVDCEAKLIKIERDGQVIWGPDVAVLTFAPWNPPHECEEKKTIRNGDTVHLDILYVQGNGEIRMGTRDRQWKLMPRIHEIFSSHGDYILTVRITGTPLRTETILLNFTWTGNWNTAQMRRVMPPWPAPEP